MHFSFQQRTPNLHEVTSILLTHRAQNEGPVEVLSCSVAVARCDSTVIKRHTRPNSSCCHCKAARLAVQGVVPLVVKALVAFLRGAAVVSVTVPVDAGRRADEAACVVTVGAVPVHTCYTLLSGKISMLLCGSALVSAQACDGFIATLLSLC